MEEQAEQKSLSFAELGLTFGQELALLPDPRDKDNAFACELVGRLHEQSIIIGPPASGVLPQMAEGQRVIVRVKLAGGVALFPTTVLFISDVPAMMVYLDYPRDIRFKQVRGACRVNVALPVLVCNRSRGSKSSVAGKIVDISTSGARLEMFEPLGDVGESIEIKGKFEVGAIQRTLSVEGVIRAKSGNATQRYYGIEFHEGDEDKLLVLMGFTFHAMAFGRLQSIR